MLTAFVGPLGSGKTLAMVAWAWKYSLMAGGVPIYGNMQLQPAIFGRHQKNQQFCTGTIKTTGDIINMTRAGGGILLLDEAYRHLDARLSMQAKNIYLSQFFMYLRKIGTTVFFSAQTQNMMDLRIREILNILVRCYRGPDCFITRVYDYQNRYLIKEVTMPAARAEYFFKGYNTFEFIKDFKFPHTKRDFEKFMSDLESAQAEYKEGAAIAAGAAGPREVALL